MKTLFFCLLMMASVEIYSQSNLVQNPGFEDAISSTYNDYPNDFSQFSKAKKWKDDEKIKYCPGTIPGYIWSNITGNGNYPEQFFIHSPDWYGNGIFPFEEELPSGQFWVISPVTAHNGGKYIGMGFGELITQEFSPNDLMEGHFYTIRFYIRLISRGNLNNNNIILPTNALLPLKVFLSKEKINYKFNKCEFRFCDGIDFHEFDDFDDGPLQMIHEIGNFQLSFVNYPIGNWHQVQAEFTVPACNGNCYKWVTIELQESLTKCDNYVLIDDVSITCGCEVDCSNLDGCVEPTFYANTINQNSYFRVSNLSNVSEATLKITSVLGQTLVTNYTSTVNCENGILGDLVWTGVNNNGADLAAGTYFAELTATNLCGTHVISAPQSIMKVDNYDFGANPIFNYSCNPLIPEIPEPCCPSIVDFFIDNATISGPDYLEWKINHNLNVATLPGSIVTLEANANVLFQAGNQVKIGPGMLPLAGSQYQIKIEPCPQMRIGNQNAESWVFENEDITSPIEAKDVLEQIKIFPNPSQSTATFLGKFPGEVTGIWELFDPAGQRIHSGCVDQSSKEVTFPVSINHVGQGVFFLKSNFTDSKGHEYFQVNKVVFIR